jgi:hypothetical protein
MARRWSEERRSLGNAFSAFRVAASLSFIFLWEDDVINTWSCVLGAGGFYLTLLLLEDYIADALEL